MTEHKKLGSEDRKETIKHGDRVEVCGRVFEAVTSVNCIGCIGEYDGSLCRDLPLCGLAHTPGFVIFEEVIDD